MYLKTLELQGFKSFPDKTKLSFESTDVTVNAAGVTVIVGPNGSGKSNISDAMRWVLGEISSKSLRGSKMEDVIFGGADSRKPMGYAEVSVTFDNTAGVGRLECPYDEVTVTRRYYRVGESEYFINRRAVRLKDIYELFMNTGIGRDGYSIIGQGKIAEIISKKSDERRAAFEDASGIAKYRHKKNEAENKLAQTEDNMTRIRDVFSEVEAQVGPLAKEAEKAKRAIELMELKKKADIGLWLYDTERLRLDLAQAQERLSHSTFDLGQVEDTLLALDQQNDKLFERSQSNKQESEQLLTEIRRQTEINHTLDSEFRVGETRIAHTKELIAAADGSIASIERSRENEARAKVEQIEQIGALREKEKNLENEQAALTESIKDQNERSARLDDALAEAFEEIREREKEAVDLRVRVSVLENARDTDVSRNDSMSEEMRGYMEIAEDLGKKCAARQKTIDGYQKSMDEADSAIAEKQAEFTRKNDAVREEEQALNGARLRRDSIAQKINTYRDMEEHFEGYAGSVRFVMSRYAEGKITAADGSPCGKIYGPLSKLITVEDAYLTAVETALGTNLQNIVVADESTAKAAMYALKRGEAGRATFFPLTSMKPSPVSREVQDAAGYRGYVDTADKLVNCDGAFRDVIASLLSRTVIFDTIDNATVMARALHFRVRAVTLDGQQINVGGSFTGGSVKQNGGVLSRAAEIKRLGGELEALEKSLAADAEKLKTAKGAVEELQEEIEDANARRELLATLCASETAALEQVAAKRDANQSLMDKLQADFKQLEEMRAHCEEEIRDLAERERELTEQIQALGEARNAKSEEKADLEESLETMDRRMTEIYIALSETRKDIDTAQMLADASEERIASFADEIAAQENRKVELTEQIRATEEKLKENRSMSEEGTALLDELNAKRNEVEAGGIEFERRLNELNQRRREKQNQKELLLLENSKNENKVNSLQTEQDKLQTRLWDDYEMTRNDALAAGFKPVEASERAEQVRIQTECKNKLRVIGHVDLDAVEKYEEVRVRYETMKVQIDDLEKSRQELTGVISRLEKEMKSSFVEAFNKINDNFGRVFAELFGGGSAEISLTDPEDVLESGIEIKAAPPGKIIKSLMQLSGGEQAFVAIALFFAILQVNPPPFCILDEIEAALDEVNVARLSEYIKRYTGTQFILITHRRGTMEAATRLYGVTMPEHGISKVLSLDVKEIADGKKKGGEWDGILE